MNLKDSPENLRRIFKRLQHPSKIAERQLDIQLSVIYKSVVEQGEALKGAEGKNPDDAVQCTKLLLFTLPANQSDERTANDPSEEIACRENSRYVSESNE